MFTDWSPNARHCGFAVAALTLLVLVAAVGAGHSVADTKVHNQSDEDDDEAEFATADGILITTGDTAEIQVETNGYWSVVLTLDRGYDEQDVALELTDSDSDGQITLRVNTSVAGDANRTLSSAFTLEGDGDEMQFRKPDRDATTPVLQPDSYTLGLRVSGNWHDSTELHIEERWPNGTLLTSSTVQYENLTSTTAVDEARRDGRLRASRNMREGDVLALRINSSALAAAMETANGTNATDRFRSLLAGNETRLFFQQTNPEAEFDPLYGFASKAEQMRVVAGTSADIYYVVFDTTTVPGRRCDAVTECDTISDWLRPFEYRDSYRVNFTLAGEPIVGYNEDLHISVGERATDDTVDSGGDSTPAANQTNSDGTPTSRTQTVTTGSSATATEKTTTRDSNETVTPAPATGTRAVSTTTGTGPGFGAVSTLLALGCSALWLWAGRSTRD